MVRSTIIGVVVVLLIAKAAAAGLKVVPSAQIPKGREAEFMSEQHVHRRAQRVMEKELLKDLWVAWRKAARSPLAEAAD